ncbi:MAG: hypothetical protein AAGE37_06615 [Pseudomonadota bacterium]
MVEKFQFEERDGILVGPERNPLNVARHYGSGSIHDDNTAKKLGFRGGTVAGSLHMEQFPPLLAAALGEEWERTGGFSLYFKKATTDGEPVRAFAEKPKPGEKRIRTWMENEEGDLVAEGTANIGGEDLGSAVRERIESMPPAEDLRMFASVVVGESTPRVTAQVPTAALDARLEVITEPLPAYSDESIHGGRTLTPALQVHILSQAAPKLMTNPADLGVGLYGAIELQQYGRPVLVDHEYEVQATALALGETPKTEYIYYESKLFEPGSDECVLSMIMMNRFMKQFSRLWQ